MIISVIVPIYKVEKYLKKCIDSVINQTYKDIEIILVDDGGTDACPKICDEYALKDNRITVIHKKNGGLSDARNAGLDICKGEYIFFVDSDDYIHPNTLKEMVNVAKNCSADIVECDVMSIDEADDSAFDNAVILDDIYIYSHDEAIEKMLDYDFKIMAWNKLYKRELFKEIRFPIGKIHEDEFTIPYIVDRCNVYVKLPKQYYAYVQRGNSIMSMNYTERWQDILEAHEQRMVYFNDKYKNKYDLIMYYHLFVVCINLKCLMGKYYKGSKVQLVVRKCGKKLLLTKAKTKVKIKAIIYLISPQIIYKYKSRARMG